MLRLLLLLLLAMGSKELLLPLLLLLKPRGPGGLMLGRRSLLHLLQLVQERPLLADTSIQLPQLSISCSRLSRILKRLRRMGRRLELLAALS